MGPAEDDGVVVQVVVAGNGALEDEIGGAYPVVAGNGALEDEGTGGTYDGGDGFGDT